MEIACSLARPEFQLPSVFFICLGPAFLRSQLHAKQFEMQKIMEGRSRAGENSVNIKQHWETRHEKQR